MPGNDVLSGDKEFFEALENSVRHNYGKLPIQPNVIVPAKKSTDWTRVAVIIFAGCALISLAVIYTSFHSRSPARNSKYLSAEQLKSEQAPAQPENQPLQQQVPLQPKVVEQPLSLKLANDLFLRDDYKGALSAYERLDETLANEPEKRLMQSFLKLRIACCLIKLKKIDKADELLRTVSSSDCCGVAAVANYQRALLELERKEYLEARKLAYRAAALAETLTADTEWVLNFKKDCLFLIAMSLNRRVTSLSDADIEISSKLWQITGYENFGCDKSESQLETAFKSANSKLAPALMSPVIKTLDINDSFTHYEVISNIAPAEELFASFATKSNTKLTWLLPDKTGEFKRKSVSLFLPDVTTEEFFSVAAGCTGLLATFDSQLQIVTLSNPSEYSELSDYVSAISDEALDRWQEFIIRHHEDKRLANAHFACGIIYKIQGRTVESISQFKTVANRYSNSPLAPYALLNSSTIKADLHDYAGAKEDLRQLVEQYNQTDITQKALLYLADAALKAGLYDEALNTYSRVYNIDDSLESRMAAAFGAAQATFAKKDYAETEIWLTKYMNLATQYSDSELHEAYLMLGKAQLQLNKRTEAFNAFKLALNGELTTKDRSDIITALLKCDLDKLDPIPAFDLIETLQMQGLSPQEYTEAVLMNCRILRKIHLPQKALAVLNDRFDYIIEPQLRARAYFEAGLCYIDLEQTENAHGCFTRLLSIAEPGLLADKASLKLAELSLKLNKDEKAIKICTELLERNNVADDLRKSAVNTLAQAYKKQNDYQKVIQLLVEQNPSQTTDEKTISNLRPSQNPEHEEL